MTHWHPFTVFDLDQEDVSAGLMDSCRSVEEARTVLIGHLRGYLEKEGSDDPFGHLAIQLLEELPDQHRHLLSTTALGVVECDEEGDNCESTLRQEADSAMTAYCNREAVRALARQHPLYSVLKDAVMKRAGLDEPAPQTGMYL